MASCTFIAEGSCESRQAVTQASDVVAGATAVHALRAGLAAAVSVKPRRADWNQRGQSVTAACQQPPCRTLAPALELALLSSPSGGRCCLCSSVIYSPKTRSAPSPQGFGVFWFIMTLLTFHCVSSHPELG